MQLTLIPTPERFEDEPEDDPEPEPEPEPQAVEEPPMQNQASDTEADVSRGESSMDPQGPPPAANGLDASTSGEQQHGGLEGDPYHWMYPKLK